jgi:hypothetical protein
MAEDIDNHFFPLTIKFFVSLKLLKNVFATDSHGQNWTKNCSPGPTKTGRANQPSPGGEAVF